MAEPSSPRPNPSDPAARRGDGEDGSALPREETDGASGGSGPEASGEDSGTPGGEPAAGPDDGSSSHYGQGFRWEEGLPPGLGEVIEAAFDYRGDVTLELRSGESVKGYLANRDGKAADPFVDVFLADGSGRRRLRWREVRAVSFTGRDPATGKSWETWLRKWHAKKEAESRGERVQDISLYPDAVD